MLGRLNKVGVTKRDSTADFRDVTPPTLAPPFRVLLRRQEQIGGIGCLGARGMGDVIQFCRCLRLLGVPHFLCFLTRPCLASLVQEWSGYGERVSRLAASNVRLIQGSMWHL